MHRRTQSTIFEDKIWNIESPGKQIIVLQTIFKQMCFVFSIPYNDPKATIF